jgi:hypothetical protein
MDGAVLVWRLHPEMILTDKKPLKNPIFRFDYKNGRFSDVAVKTDSKSVVYAVTDDRAIKELDSGKEKLRYEAPVAFS